MNARQRITQLEKNMPTAKDEKSSEAICAEIQAKLARLARGELNEPNTEPLTREGEEARRRILERLAKIAAVQNGSQ
ncbi:MAG: hypothetical protein HYR70_13445 [Chloroflexi bacterium]|nr:hypothetical protein [Chloroflexota bacterium]MBI3339636.1 hypothetical protein [Chloroflexota bacterium]